jgi:DNA-binding NarL/FixJ family response regulator
MAEQRAMGVGELSIAAVPEQAIDALVADGRLDDAWAVADELAALGVPAERSWHAAVAGRGRALVAAARGDYTTAFSALAMSYEAHDRLANPFTLARTHLAAGVIARRARRWADARRRFTDALELFDRLGASRWAERAATELGRLPGRPGTRGALTETERAVAELVAEGLTNKAIAARLSVTTRTVEQHVSSVYRKLDVDSRTMLARTLLADEL